MFGVNDNVYFCNMDRLESINSQIRNRNIPSEPLRPEFSLRPVATQRCVLPIVDNIGPSCVPLQKYDQFSVEKVFNPGTAQAPWDGFAANINVDSLLRNQFFALQRCSQAEFVPSSNGPLFVHPLALNSSEREVKTSVEDLNAVRNCKMPEHSDKFNHSTRFHRTTIKNNNDK
jgi:hypothetical protein